MRSGDAEIANGELGLELVSAGETIRGVGTGEGRRVHRCTGPATSAPQRRAAREAREAVPYYHDQRKQDGHAGALRGVVLELTAWLA